MRRALAIITFVALIAGLLTACSRSPQAAVDIDDINPKGQVILLWHPYSGEEETLFLEMVDQFNLTNPWDIVILTEGHDTMAAIDRRIAAGIKDDKLPDLTATSPFWLAEYASQDLLTPLDPLIESSRFGYSNEEISDFYPAALKVDDLPHFEERYAWPAYRSMDVLYYNRDWIIELGYPGAPETWNSFAEMACAAAEQTFSGARGDRARATIGYEYSPNAHWFSTLIATYGLDVYDAEAGSYAFASPPAIDAVRFMRDLAGGGCIGLVNEPQGDQLTFSEGRELFTIAPIRQLLDYRERIASGAGFRWGITPPPHDTEQPHIHLYGVSYGIFRSRPERELAAWLFVKWMNRPGQQARWVRATASLPSRRSTLYLLETFFEETPAYAEAIGYLDGPIHVTAPVVGYDECRGVLYQSIAAVMTGGDDVTSRLEATAARCTELLTPQTAEE